jgi:hypothetical protein
MHPCRLDSTNVSKGRRPGAVRNMRKSQSHILTWQRETMGLAPALLVEPLFVVIDDRAGCNHEIGERPEYFEHES